MMPDEWKEPSVSLQKLRATEHRLIRMMFGRCGIISDEAKQLPMDADALCGLYTGGLDLTDKESGIVAGLDLAIEYIQRKEDAITHFMLAQDVMLHEKVERSIQLKEARDIASVIESIRNKYIEGFIQKEER